MIRFFDILFSVLGLLILSPLFLIIILFIKFNSRGPVIYKQKRIGKNLIDFDLYKFRSMRIGSDQKGLLTVGNLDPRITSVGLFIRKYKLDELPQLMNVLKGDMSIVGPRPEVKKYIDCYTKDQMLVLSVKPGITDYASVEFSNENELLSQAEDHEKLYIEMIIPEKIKLNMKFINKPTIFNYFKIIMLTFKKIIRIR